MAFVASSLYGSMNTGALPMMSDASGNNLSQCSFSHVRVLGLGAITFDTGHVVGATAGTETVAPIPPGARSIVVGGGTPIVQLGQAV
jgi:hypothetical protein